VANFPAVQRNGSVEVPEGTQQEAIALLSESGDLPDDTTILFNNLVTKQDWRHSREQHRQQYLFALQNELGRVIGKFRGLRVGDGDHRRAGAARGWGGRAADPTASVTVFPSGGRRSTRTRSTRWRRSSRGPGAGCALRTSRSSTA
jgi:hypothetical protein